MADPQRLPEPLVANWEWHTTAACRGLDCTMFYHPFNERNEAREARIAQAKAICQQCPVAAGRRVSDTPTDDDAHQPFTSSVRQSATSR